MLIYTYKEQVCIKKDHEKFKILDILAVTTQAREGIETRSHQFLLIQHVPYQLKPERALKRLLSPTCTHWLVVTTQAQVQKSACPRQKSINFIKVL